MVDALLATLQGNPPFIVLVLMLLTAFSTVLLFLRLFGAPGLYTVIALAVIAANIQVQKLVQFGFYAEPVALGTVLFSTTYLATDILNEYYGSKAARRGVMIGFLASLFWVIVMVLTVGFVPLTPEQAGDAYGWALATHDHIAGLFTPLPGFLLASLCAYLVSQHLDVWIFSRMRRAMGDHFLWLRNNVSTMMSGLVDNAIFSTLAFVVFASEPVGFQPLLLTFILGTYALRCAIALLDTPIMYLAKRCIPPSDRVNIFS